MLAGFSQDDDIELYEVSLFFLESLHCQCLCVCALFLFIILFFVCDDIYVVFLLFHISISLS
jgi:hypothetical protein